MHFPRSIVALATLLPLALAEDTTSYITEEFTVTNIPVYTVTGLPGTGIPVFTITGQPGPSGTPLPIFTTTIITDIPVSTIIGKPGGDIPVYTITGKPGNATTGLPGTGVIVVPGTATTWPVYTITGKPGGATTGLPGTGVIVLPGTATTLVTVTRGPSPTQRPSADGYSFFTGPKCDIIGTAINSQAGAGCFPISSAALSVKSLNTAEDECIPEILACTSSNCGDCTPFSGFGIDECVATTTTPFMSILIQKSCVN